MLFVYYLQIGGQRILVTRYESTLTCQIHFNLIMCNYHDLGYDKNDYDMDNEKYRIRCMKYKFEIESDLPPKRSKNPQALKRMECKFAISVR